MFNSTELIFTAGVAANNGKGSAFRWNIRFLIGGLCKSQKKYRACASGFKKISCRIVKKEKNIEQL